jgi:hypothetical protein
VLSAVKIDAFAVATSAGSALLTEISRFQELGFSEMKFF